MSNIAQNQNPPIEFDCPHCGSPTEIEAPTLNAIWEYEADGQYQCPACQESYILPDQVAELSGIIYEKDGPQDCVVSMSGDCPWVTHVETGQRQVIKDEYLADIRLPNKWSPVTIDKQGRKLVGIPLTEKELGDAPGGILSQWKEGWITLALAEKEIESLREYVDRTLLQKNPALLQERIRNCWKKVAVGILGLLMISPIFLASGWFPNDGQTFLFSLCVCAVFWGISGGIELIRLKQLAPTSAAA